MIDVSGQINVQRVIGNRVLDVGQVRVATVSQSYDATIDDVWDACTNPDRIPRWFLPVSGELRVGGRYQLTGNASGTIERCDAPNGFSATWEYGGEVSWIEVRLSPAAQGRTLFTLEHLAKVDDERWAEYGPGAVGVGWDMTVLGLALHLLSGQSNDPAEWMDWMTSDEGREFMTRSSLCWRDASVQAGTDPAVARARAHRTTAFYTGAPAPTEA